MILSKKDFLNSYFYEMAKNIRESVFYVMSLNDQTVSLYFASPSTAETGFGVVEQNVGNFSSIIFPNPSEDSDPFLIIEDQELISKIQRFNYSVHYYGHSDSQTQSCALALNDHGIYLGLGESRAECVYFN